MDLIGMYFPSVFLFKHFPPGVTLLSDFPRSLARLSGVRGTSTMTMQTTTVTFECTRESLLKSHKWAPPVSWQHISKLFLFYFFSHLARAAGSVVFSL